SPSLLSLFLFSAYAHHPDLHSFPTRRSSDLVVGGELGSRKGLNLPGVDLGISAFTEHDRACLEFALKEGVDAVGQSFVERAADIDRKSTRLNSSHVKISYAVFCLKKKREQ